MKSDDSKNKSTGPSEMLSEKERLFKEVLGRRRPIGGHSSSLKGSEHGSEYGSEHADTPDIASEKPNDLYAHMDLQRLRQELERDFGVAFDADLEVDPEQAFERVEGMLLEKLSEHVLGQEAAVRDLVSAWKRPFLRPHSTGVLRGVMYVYGPRGTGKHLMVTRFLEVLHESGGIMQSEPAVLDMSLYTAPEQEPIFIQDIYSALNGSAPLIVIEHFEQAHVLFSGMLADLMNTGAIPLNKRYTEKEGILKETGQALQADIVKHLSGNSKYLVFISESAPRVLLDVYGKTVHDLIVDKIQTRPLERDTVKIILARLLADMQMRAKTHLGVEAQVLESGLERILEAYEPLSGVERLLPEVEALYAWLEQHALTHSQMQIPAIRLGFEGDAEASSGWYAESEGMQTPVSLNAHADASAFDIQAALADVVGLESVKAFLTSFQSLVTMNRLRRKQGKRADALSMHMIFTGNPGTGKTMIARLVARYMKSIGILEQGQLVEVSRADLVGKYVGHTAPLTMSVIKSALGGVLFIDEAYSLYRGKDDSFGLEAIDTLVKGMEDNRDHLIVILAGYSKEMADFLEANSGLRSRFSHMLHFDDYTATELVSIAQIIAKNKGYTIEEAALEALHDYFEARQSDDAEISGNGRLARNVVEAAIVKQSERLLKGDAPETQGVDCLEQRDFQMMSSKGSSN